MDSCFRSDGEPYGRKNSTWTDANVPEHELRWLENDLRSNSHPVIVFAHQRLDVGTAHGVRNAPQVRSILEASKSVRAVFQGHSHANDVNEINGIPYCTLVAMVEGEGEANNGFSVMTLDRFGVIAVDGFVKQADHRWPAR